MKKKYLNITVDAGNTRIKIALFLPGILRPTKELQFQTADKNLAEFLHSLPNDSALILSNVTAIPTSSLLQGYCGEPHELLPQTPLPFQIHYRSTETLGADRKANAAALSIISPSKYALCIDAGTCLKADLVNPEGHYLGGSISPGLKMRLQAMHQFTGRLPLLEPTQKFVNTGQSTEDCMLSGAIGGMQKETNGLIRYYQDEFPGIDIWITGGDLSYLQDEVKNNIFAEPFLTHIGLNRILQFLRRPPSGPAN